MTTPEERTQRTVTVVRALSSRMSDGQRVALRDWASRLLEIRTLGVSELRKARLALDVTYRAEIVLPVIKAMAESVKDLVWDDRSWAGRLGLGTAGVAAMAFGKQGAGIAALGGAIGLPLWIVLGAGGSFAGMLVDELQRTIATKPGPDPSAPGAVIDAEWSFAENPGPAGHLPKAGVKDGDGARTEPLWKVFRKAFREARAREKQAQERAPQPPGTSGPSSGA